MALRTQTAQFHAEAEKLLKHESAPAPASRIVKDDTLEKTYGTHSERKPRRIDIGLQANWRCTKAFQNSQIMHAATVQNQRL